VVDIMRWLAKRGLKLLRGQRGISLIETLMAVAILGAIAVPFLSGLATVSRASFDIDRRTTAESLARTQMEWAKDATYVESATQYSPASLPSGKDFVNYSAVITAEPLHDPDDGLQKITVTIEYSGETILRLEGYKRRK
jgi:type II secretory pathway pseudopilin PulG